MANSFNAGFLRDPSGVLAVTTTTTGATWQEGFLRAPTGELVVTTDTTNAFWWSGFLRSPTGVLVIEVDTAGTYHSGFVRSTTGALVVTQGLTGAAWHGGFLRGTGDLLIVSGLSASPLFVDVQSGTVASGTNIVIPVPAVANGDLMLAAIADRGSSTDTVTPPAGWVQVIAQARGSVGKLFIYSKTASGESGSYTFVTSATNTQIGLVAAWRNVTAVNVSAGATATVTTGLHTTPTVTTTLPEAVVARFACTAVTNLPCSWTWPTSTERFDGNVAGTGAGGISLASLVQAGAGATGTEDATFAQSSSTTYATATIALA